MTTNGFGLGDRPAIRRVVAGVDGSDSALHAALWAAREAWSLDVPLLLTHALHLPDAPRCRRSSPPTSPCATCARAMSSSRASPRGSSISILMWTSRRPRR